MTHKQTTGCRHIICQHRVEVMVAPAVAEVCFQDERFAHPLNTSVQFQAFVYNAPTNRVTWTVNNLSGGPGAGTIDAGGLYVAPLKGFAPFSLTDVVVATSVDDQFRRAFAHVAVVGRGPEPKPAARIEVFPNRVHVYHPTGPHNQYIDLSNTMQLFRVIAKDADLALVQWRINDVDPVLANGPEFLWQAPSAGGVQTVKVTARIPGSPPVTDFATVTVLNYNWPGILT